MIGKSENVSEFCKKAVTEATVFGSISYVCASFLPAVNPLAGAAFAATLQLVGNVTDVFFRNLKDNLELDKPLKMLGNIAKVALIDMNCSFWVAKKIAIDFTVASALQLAAATFGLFIFIVLLKQVVSFCVSSS